MGLFDNFDDIIDSWLKIDESWKGSAPRYANKTNLDRLCEECAEICDGSKLANELFGQLEDNWDGRPCSGNQNWRHTQNLILGDANSSLEVTLQRTFMNIVKGGDWANEVPIASGVTATGANSVDFVLKSSNGYSMIELKWPKEGVFNETPLKAAIQVLRYGLAYVFSRLNLEALGYDAKNQPILEASQVHLRLLAPVRFFAPFIENGDWLQRLEESLNKRIGSIAQDNNFDMTFAFEQFPEEFDWNPSRMNEEKKRIEVINAFANRQRLF